jgi:post-segregation antitoxin (ccd killing protein)
MKQLTKTKTIRISDTQMKSLKALEAYGVNVNQFIRIAIKEKLTKDWRKIKQEKNKEYCPF